MSSILEDGVLGLEWVLVQGPREIDSEMEIAWRKFIAEGAQDQHVWVGWRAEGGWKKQDQADGGLNCNDGCSYH